MMIVKMIWVDDSWDLLRVCYCVFGILFSIYYAILITSFIFPPKLNKTAKTLSTILLASLSNL